MALRRRHYVFFVARQKRRQARGCCFLFFPLLLRFPSTPTKRTETEVINNNRIEGELEPAAVDTSGL